MASSLAVRHIDVARRLTPAIALLTLTVLVLAGPAASVAGAACPCSLWNDGTVPTTAAVNDTNSVELGVKVVPSVNGTITGARFYKSALNTGTHVGNLWTVGGTQLASVAFTNETDSGWQQANFATPVAVTANTTYVASYHAPSGSYAFDSNYFATAFVNGPLSAPSSEDSGGNGVFSYGPSGFPVNSFNAANYWVDVVFNEADTTAPTVVSVSPDTERRASTSVSIRRRRSASPWTRRRSRR